MKEIQVKASREYSVRIGAGLLPEAGDHISRVCRGRRAVIVSDTNVAGHYAGALESSLRSKGFDVSTFVFEAGEENKTGQTLLEMLSFIAESRLTRQDMVVALGGGVTGDMAGLASAMYMRGIDYIQIPTSILAAVDSSVGGKTAIDLPQGKNLAGAFHQPALVIIDTDVFRTLPDRDRRNGFAEIIKYGMISDPRILDQADLCAEKELAGDKLEELIARCVEIKADIVEKDEFEAGQRMLLNFGHTIGHAIEKASHFRLLHGEAVAAGMVMITEGAERAGICESGTCEKLKQALKTCELPTSMKEAADIAGSVDIQDVLEHAAADKKNTNEGIQAVIPESVGKCGIRKMGLEELAGFIWTE